MKRIIRRLSSTFDIFWHLIFFGLSRRIKSTALIYANRTNYISHDCEDFAEIKLRWRERYRKGTINHRSVERAERIKGGGRFWEKESANDIAPAVVSAFCRYSERRFARGNTTKRPKKRSRDDNQWQIFSCEYLSNHGRACAFNSRDNHHSGDRCVTFAKQGKLIIGNLLR